MQLETEEYMTIERVNAVRERAGKLRRQFLKLRVSTVLLTGNYLRWLMRQVLSAESMEQF